MITSLFRSWYERRDYEDSEDKEMGSFNDQKAQLATFVEETRRQMEETYARVERSEYLDVWSQER